MADWKDGVRLLISLASIVFTMYLTYLILNHIEATEFMWFYFAVMVTLLLINAGINVALYRASMKQEIRKEIANYMRELGFSGKR